MAQYGKHFIYRRFRELEHGKRQSCMPYQYIHPDVYIYQHLYIYPFADAEPDENIYLYIYKYRD